MSLAIEVDDVISVLLADGWHSVYGRSFNLDAYEFIWRKGTNSRGDVPVLHGGGASGICSTGFLFEEKDEAGWIVTMAGPLTAILAVKHAQRRK